MLDDIKKVGVGTRVRNQATGVPYTVLDFTLDNILLEADVNFGRERVILQTCDDINDRNALEQLASWYDIIDDEPQPDQPDNRLYCGICGQTNVADTNEAGDEGWEPQVYLSPVNAKRERWIDEVCPHCVRAFCEPASDGTIGLKYPSHHPAKAPEGVETISP